MGFRGYQREADSHRAQPFLGSTRARGEGVLETTELQSRDPYHREELQLTLCDCQQFLQGEQWTEDRYGLLVDILVSHVGMAWTDDHASLISALCELVRKTWPREKLVEPHSMSVVKMRSTGQAARLVAGRKVTRGIF